MDEYINAQCQANGFDLCYSTTLKPADKDWRDYARFLSGKDFA
ncbi:MAG: hypothetical protein OXC48_03610 [Endozoicomonadaceae bacterium]|nr:hypothetical protein [Endozoicomonadaceae bacterium]